MEKQTLLKISLSISFFGILILLFISNLEPKISSISKIKAENLNSLIKIQGKIIQIKKINQNFYLLTLKDNTETIQAISGRSFPVNSTIEIIGKLQNYQNKLQIQTEKIKLK